VIIAALGSRPIIPKIKGIDGANVYSAEEIYFHPEKAGASVAAVAGDMLDACAPLARWCDVFCEQGAFDEGQARTILTAAREHGLGLRVHANQLGEGPGARLAAEMGAASADHVTYLSDADVDALAQAGVVATLLPTADLCTREPWPRARALLGAGATVALATDCNPGTSFTTNMPLVIALAVLGMRMSPTEAVWSATAGGAAALRRGDVGRLSPGARADLVVLDAPSHVQLAYRLGVVLIRTVVRDGNVRLRTA
jgi:imidazolonepropionase